MRQRDTEIQRLREEIKQISPSINRNIIADAGDYNRVQLSVGDGCAVNACECVESRASVRGISRLSSGGGSVAREQEYVESRASRHAEAADAGGRERVETRASRHVETVYKLKPDIFDGSAPLREFFAQFDLIAYANHWGKETKTAVLVSCLRGKARAVLENIQNLENLEYSELRAKLELRFEEAHSLQNYYTQFTNRKQKFGENVAAFGSDIERLARLAYPECSDLMRNKIACAQFVSTLSDGYTERALQMEGIASLRLAIERAKAVQLIQGTCFGNKKENNFYFENRKRKNFNEGKDESNEIDKKRENNKEKNDKVNKNGIFFFK
ncbi:hypothetical protein ALC57_09638 [Trachymyrmex cornetzi]|uniref:Retrotransposon gag domain-containing protein n=1 Tax=Trachymyrmex cornetzi TaxID=471704 RepID=A0A151J558_9HYME|nr:hypothetical protein ALC57_09638 [Trachymyrmex cornetzi]